jgi:signal transduction histidine kinase/ActR/RegA family two-component response regulator
MSGAIYNIADREVDALKRSGFPGDKKWTKIHQVQAEIEIEDFARENDIGVIISALSNKDIIFETGLSEDIKNILRHLEQQPNSNFLSTVKGAYFLQSIDFKLWNWRIILVKDASAFSSLVKKVRNFYIVTGITLLCITILLIAYLRRAIGQPINQIVECLKKEEAPEYKGISQLEFLSDSFAHFITLRKQAEQELAKHRDHLEELVKVRTSELIELNKRLEEAVKQMQEAKLTAEKAKQAKSQFLANISHEIRTPLSSIKGYTSLVMRQSKDILPPKQYENLGRVLVSYDQLYALINDLLDLSKIEAGRMDVYPVNFQLEPLIDECLHTIEPMVKEKQLRLVKELEDGQSLLFNDKEKVKRILNNLLSNALKFTEKGTITVFAQCLNGKINITIADTGIGISSDAQALLFQDFYQVNDSSTRQHSGTGLGLAISRRLAHLMGGDITFESTIGVGSTFTITIPMRYGTTQPDGLEGATSNRTRQATTPLMNFDKQISRDAKKILVIEDIQYIRDFLVQRLEENYDILIAVDGKSGIKMAEHHRPDLILMDLSLPVMDGWEATSRIKANESFKSIPIIALTAHAMQGDKEKAMASGCDDYLTKPIDEDLLFKKIRQFLGDVY